MVNAKALLVELLNPFEVLLGFKARFGLPIKLDLGDFGIREIAWRKKQKYLIVASPYYETVLSDGLGNNPTRLYQWCRKSGVLKRLKRADLININPEAAFFYPSNKDFVQLLSDGVNLGETAHYFQSLSVDW